MTSQSISRRQQIAQMCQFWVMFGSQFLDNGLTDFETVPCFINNGSTSSLAVVQVVIHFCFLTPKCDKKDVPGSATYISSLFRFSGTTTEASNSQIRSLLIMKNLTGYDVIGYFRSAANRIITPMFNPFWRPGWICVVTPQVIASILIYLHQQSL